MKSLRLWIIDDTHAHHRVAEATVAELSAVGTIVVEHFYSGQEGDDAYRERLEAGGPLPDVILMDFFLGDTRGDHLTRQLRRLEHGRHHAHIVGYSSVPSGSAAIVAAGADSVLPKRVETEVNPYLADFLIARLA
jgi:CheY-like chemotaxis protein